jgi:hypothetical protein
MWEAQEAVTRRVSERDNLSTFLARGVVWRETTRGFKKGKVIAENAMSGLSGHASPVVTH